jgi:hypothetical protein
MPYYEVRFLLKKNCANRIANIIPPINIIAVISKLRNSPKGAKLIKSRIIAHVPEIPSVIKP